MRVKLNDLTKYSKGSQINGDELIDDGKYIYLNGGINPSGKWNSYNVEANTVTISEGGNSSGYVNFISEPFWCGAHCYYLYDGPKNTRYLYYALKSQQERLFAIRSGACMPNIKKADLGKFEIEFETDLKMQDEIVSVLSKAESIINARQNELSKFDELIKARFVELFGNPVSNEKGWDTDTCKKLMSKIGSGATPKGGRESYGTEGISLIRSMNVYNNKFEYKDLAHITDEQASKLDNVTIEKRDVLLNITGASVARCCIVPDDLLPARVNQHVSIIRCKDKLLPEFVCCMFTEDNYQKLLWNIATAGGATREAITKQQIEDLVLIVPPMELQEQFMDFVKQVDKSKLAVQKSLEETQLLFDSLMQQYFG